MRIYLRNSAGSFLKSKKFMPQFSCSVTKSVLTDLSSFRRSSFLVRSCNTESRRLPMDVVRELRRSIGSWTILGCWRCSAPSAVEEAIVSAALMRSFFLGGIVNSKYCAHFMRIAWLKQLGNRKTALYSVLVEWLRRKSRLIALTRSTLREIEPKHVASFLLKSTWLLLRVIGKQNIRVSNLLAVFE